MNNQEWIKGSMEPSSMDYQIYNPTAIPGFNPPPVFQVKALEKCKAKAIVATVANLSTDPLGYSINFPSYSY